MKAFVTGSRKYGIPTKDSDTDLAILVDPEDYEVLVEMAEEVIDYDNVNGAAVRFGGLNLLIFTNEERFLCWKLATGMLRRSAPIKLKQVAIATIEHVIKTVEEGL